MLIISERLRSQTQYNIFDNGAMGCSSPTKPLKPFFFNFFLVKCSKKGKMDKYILTNNKITGDKPSQQLLSKVVATQLPLLN